jgi:hypothetical protein
LSYEPFHSRFPELAAEETRVITIFKESNLSLPPGEYALVESFCNEPRCDCRRVFLSVFAKDLSGMRAVITQAVKTQAVISFGWERRAFYVRWFGSNDPKMIANLKGPALAIGQPQSNLAPLLLKVVKEIVLSDSAYVERLKRHYVMFRASVAKSGSSE